MPKVKIQFLVDTNLVVTVIKSLYMFSSGSKPNETKYIGKRSSKSTVWSFSLGRNLTSLVLGLQIATETSYRATLMDIMKNWIWYNKKITRFWNTLKTLMEDSKIFQRLFHEELTMFLWHCPSSSRCKRRHKLCRCLFSVWETLFYHIIRKIYN